MTDDTVTANPDAPCLCEASHPLVPQKRPLATYLFCKVCGRTRARIMGIAFRIGAAAMEARL